MAGERATTRLEQLRVRLSTKIRAIADDLTDGMEAGSHVRRQLYDVADRYAAGTESEEDGMVLIRLHAWVTTLTADLVRKVERQDV